MKLEFSTRILEKYSNTKFNQYPSSGSWVFACGQTDGRTWQKLIVPLSNLSTVPKNHRPNWHEQSDALLLKYWKLKLIFIQCVRFFFIWAPITLITKNSTRFCSVGIGRIVTVELCVSLFLASNISTFNFKSVETAMEIYQDLRNVCGDDCLGLAQVFRWFAPFQEGG